MLECHILVFLPWLPLPPVAKLPVIALFIRLPLSLPLWFPFGVAGAPELSENAWDYKSEPYKLHTWITRTFRVKCHVRSSLDSILDLSHFIDFLQQLTWNQPTSLIGNFPFAHHHVYSHAAEYNQDEQATKSCAEDDEGVSDHFWFFKWCQILLVDWFAPQRVKK